MDLPGGHFGLQGIRERVDKLGGTVEIESRAGEGLQLTVIVPAGRSPRAVVQPALRELWRRS
jgi:glucose-6-phosphate-specific signal transduction histidine kinase